MKLRFYTTDSGLNWKQCKYCGSYCQMVMDGKPTNFAVAHRGDCAVLAFEMLSAKLGSPYSDNQNSEQNVSN